MAENNTTVQLQMDWLALALLRWKRASRLFQRTCWDVLVKHNGIYIYIFILLAMSPNQPTSSAPLFGKTQPTHAIANRPILVYEEGQRVDIFKADGLQMTWNYMDDVTKKQEVGTSQNWGPPQHLGSTHHREITPCHHWIFAWRHPTTGPKHWYPKLIPWF